MANDFKMKIEVNNVKEVKAQLAAKEKKLYHAWGLEWVSKVTPLIPVDTGRLRQSMHFRSTPKGTIVGSNVWYAHLMNSGTLGGAVPEKLNDKFSKMKRKKKAPSGKKWNGGYKFMEKSTIENKARYKEIFEKILKE